MGNQSDEMGRLRFGALHVSLLVNADGIPDIIAVNTNSGTVAVLLGNGDGTFQPTAYYERERLMLGLKADFPLDSLRSDPRSAELVRKVGLPQ